MEPNAVLNAENAEMTGGGGVYANARKNTLRYDTMRCDAMLVVVRRNALYGNLDCWYILFG